MNYKETQYGILMNIVFILTFFFTLFLYVFQVGDHPISMWFAVIMMIIFLFVFLIFFKLTISIEVDYIRIIFGIGIIQKRIKISEIKSVKKLRNKWYYGWELNLFLKACYTMLAV